MQGVFHVCNVQKGVRYQTRIQSRPKHQKRQDGRPHPLYCVLHAQILVNKKKLINLGYYEKRPTQGFHYMIN
jgi:hypothetical protein